VTLAVPPEKPDDRIIYACIEAPELNEREAAEEEVATLLGLATQVEGIVRNVGMHAGGVLIAPGKITDFCPLYPLPKLERAAFRLVPGVHAKKETVRSPILAFGGTSSAESSNPCRSLIHAGTGGVGIPMPGLPVSDVR
jgi:Bacterial DNA polymerase III alpha NTPase domain